MDKALSLKDFSLRYGNKQIFTDVNLEIMRGEIVAICGTSAGSLYHLPNVFLRTLPHPYTYSGTLLVDSAEIERLSDEDMRFVRMMNIAVLPEPNMVGKLNMQVQNYITMPFRESVKKSSGEILMDAKRIMQLFGIQTPERILKKRMSALSEKEIRAVLYAAALSTDPALAIAYTHTPDLSDEEKESLFTLLIKICKIKNIALLLLTSDIAFARQFGEQIYITKHDRLISLEGASHPYVSFLEHAFESAPIPQKIKDETALLRANHVLPARGMRRLDFTLHKGEIVSFACKNGVSIFSGKRKPVKGKILIGDASITKKFAKNVMSVSAKMPIPPVKTIDSIVCAYAVRPSLRQDTSQFYSALSLPYDYGKMPVDRESIFEVLQLGIVCAAFAEAKLILLSDIDSLARADRYELLTLLSAVCAKTGAGAIVFSSEEGVQRALSPTPNITAEPTEILL